VENRNIVNILKENNVYQLKIDKMCVEISYSENNKSFYECMLNILKAKMK